MSGRFFRAGRATEVCWPPERTVCGTGVPPVSGHGQDGYVTIDCPYEHDMAKMAMPQDAAQMKREESHEDFAGTYICTRI